ncbi:MAG TPA: type II toxin-antitoxin system RelE/ParE family toxin [Thermoanaerobaculia bacterium]|nr:type II toxin-antitoxin system RelE/ParE family toxin [Thermoanaerobaculia bacterium]
MVWTVEFDDRAVRDLRDLDPPVSREILRYLRERIATDHDPRRFGRALTGDKQGLWRYRVRDWRLICRIEEERLVVLVVGVGHRRDVYG